MLRYFLFISTILLTSCAYTLDIQQGNIIDQKDVDKLRADLTKDQVVFVLGNRVADDSFSDDKWIYLYTYKNKNQGVERTKRLTLIFIDDKLSTASGDFDIPEELQIESAKEKKEDQESLK